MSISISIPVGEWSNALPATFRSLALQAVPLQVALCDASGDPRVRDAADASGLEFAYRRHGPDMGQSDAIIEGWNHTDGEILGWLNADDALLPGALEAALEAFAADPGLDVWYGQSTIVDSEGATIGTHPAVAAITPLLLRSCTISQPSCLFKRTAVDAVGGLDPSLHYTMDWDLWCRLYLNGAQFKMSQSHASCVLFELGTKTSTMPAQRIRELFRLVSRNAGRYAAAKTVIAFCLHHLSSYTPLRSVIRNLRHRGVFPEREAGTTGFRSSGVVDQRATIPIINLTSKPQSKLVVELAGGGLASARVTVDGRTKDGTSTLEFDLKNPVAPGHVAGVAIEIQSRRGPVSLSKGYWQSH